MFTKEELDELFIYDETSPTGIRWKVDHGMHEAGDVAGYVPASRATSHIFYKGFKVSTALIVWLLHGRTLGEGKTLMPIDGDFKNTRIENIKEVNLYQNPL